jgi:hypothetical protein
MARSNCKQFADICSWICDQKKLTRICIDVESLVSIQKEVEAPLMMERILKRLLDERRAGNKEARAGIDVDLYN